ncbi:hypothetical protein BV20DRAFT_493887 [Pilatotrama ljubarskyi]|nr:hypothetical protein BV20DRAFT_493887 [Pilatotrama ljubarskyi]
MSERMEDAGGAVSGAVLLSALFGERVAFPRPTFHDTAASGVRRRKETEADCTCHSPSIECPFTSSLSSTVYPRIDDHSTPTRLQPAKICKNLPQTPSAIVQSCPARSAHASVLTDTDGLVSVLAIHEQRERSNELNADLTQLDLCLLSYWGLAVPGPKRRTVG